MSAVRPAVRLDVAWVVCRLSCFDDVVILSRQPAEVRTVQAQPRHTNAACLPEVYVLRNSEKCI